MSETIHSDRLLPSIPDTVALCMAVEERFIQVLDLHLRVRGEKTQPPKHFEGDMRRWREMAVRFKQGDYRNKQSELISLRTIAQWTLDLNCELRNQPRHVMDWGT